MPLPRLHLADAAAWLKRRRVALSTRELSGWSKSLLFGMLFPGVAVSIRRRFLAGGSPVVDVALDVVEVVVALAVVVRGGFSGDAVHAVSGLAVVSPGALVGTSLASVVLAEVADCGAMGGEGRVVAVMMPPGLA